MQIPNLHSRLTLNEIYLLNFLVSGSADNPFYANILHRFSEIAQICAHIRYEFDVFIVRTDSFMIELGIQILV